jgi:hypothetical protein
MIYLYALRARPRRARKTKRAKKLKTMARKRSTATSETRADEHPLVPGWPVDLDHDALTIDGVPFLLRSLKILP